MKESNDPRKLRGSAPVPYYAIILGALIVAGTVAGVLYGRTAQIPAPSPVTSPLTEASAPATPRY